MLALTKHVRCVLIGFCCLLLAACSQDANVNGPNRLTPQKAKLSDEQLGIVRTAVLTMMPSASVQAIKAVDAVLAEGSDRTYVCGQIARPGARKSGDDIPFYVELGATLDHWGRRQEALASYVALDDSLRARVEFLCRRYGLF